MSEKHVFQKNNYYIYLKLSKFITFYVPISIAETFLKVFNN